MTRRRPRWTLGIAIALATAITAPTEDAHAFICTRVIDSAGSESGPSLSWMDRTVSFSLHSAGTADIASTQEFDVLRNSYLPWQTAQECVSPSRTTDLAFEETETLSDEDRVGFNFLDPTDNENLLIFRDDGWAHAGQEGLIIALTTTTYNALTGEIFDADIEFNSANFAFTTSDSGVKTDLMNTAVHEIGHVIGLGHPPFPRSATMYAEAGPGETSKRALDCDDLDAVVFKYPATETNGYCSPADSDCGFCSPPGTLTRTADVFVSDVDDGLGGGCAAHGAGALWWWVLLLPRRARAGTRSSRGNRSRYRES